MKKRRRYAGLKSFLQNTLHLLLYVLIIEGFLLVILLPVSLYRLISRLLGDFAYYTMKESRKRVLQNLKIAFGDAKSLAERQYICRSLLNQIVLNSMELLALLKIPLETLKASIQIENEAVLKEISASGKSAVAVCSHLGNFPVKQVRLVAAGYPVSAIIRNANNPYLNRFWRTLMNKVEMKPIFKADLKKAIEQAQATLKQNDILCLYLDQHAGKGVKVKFFGRDVSVPVGAAVLARKYDCPVIGLFCYRLPSGKHKIVVEGPYQLTRTNQAGEDIQKNTGFFMQRVEHYVRAYPDQWFSWMHRRFR